MIHKVWSHRQYKYRFIKWALPLTPTTCDNVISCERAAEIERKKFKRLTNVCNMYIQYWNNSLIVYKLSYWHNYENEIVYISCKGIHGMVYLGYAMHATHGSFSHWGRHCINYRLVIIYSWYFNTSHAHIDTIKFSLICCVSINCWLYIICPDLVNNLISISIHSLYNHREYLQPQGLDHRHLLLYKIYIPYIIPRYLV